MLPAGPPTALPVETWKEPLEPDVDAPVSMLTSPDTPSVPASGVARRMLPLLVSDPMPLDITTSPPGAALSEVAPAVKKMPDPAPVSVAPPTKVILPAEPPVAAPEDSVTSPDAPADELPDDRNTSPVRGESALDRMMLPLLVTRLRPLRRFNAPPVAKSAEPPSMFTVPPTSVVPRP